MSKFHSILKSIGKSCIIIAIKWEKFNSSEITDGPWFNMNSHNDL